LLTVADWVQAARYAVGADPVTVAGKIPTALGAKAGAKPATAPATRTIHFSKAALLGGQNNTVTVILESQGNESGIGLDVSFDPSVLQFKGASLGADAAGGMFTVNSQNAAAGTVGLVMTKGAGGVFAAGSREIFKLNFFAVSGASATALSFGTQQPVVPQLCDAAANLLPVSFIDTSLAVALPVLNLQSSGGTVQLSWSSGFTNYVLQSSELISSTNWAKVSGTPTDNGQVITMTLPATNSQVFFRLFRAN
jgi:hypothetical protein